MDGPVIVKLGGSLITRKSSPMTPDEESLGRAARALAESGERLVVVHGGGSYGHPVALSRGLSSSSPSRDAAGASMTRLAMHELALLVARAVRSAGLNPFLFYVHEPDSEDCWRRAASLASRLLEAGATPLTHGDVSLAAGGFRVIGGDEIAYGLARRMDPRPSRVVMLMDVPGVLRDPADPGSVIGELDPCSAASLARELGGGDATGGISAKLAYASMIASLGIEVRLTSGRSEADILNALRGRGGGGTVIRGPCP